MRYHDPLMQFVFDLPLGWALDLSDSNLNTVTFRWWTAPAETAIWVRAWPTRIHSTAADEAWLASLRDEFGAEIARLDVRGAVGGLAEKQSDDGRVRVLTLRGTRLDLDIGLDGGEGKEDDQLRILRSVKVPVNRAAPTSMAQAEVEALLAQSAEAMKSRNAARTEQLAMRALIGARGAYLHAQVQRAQFPLVGAIPAIVQAMAVVGSLGSGLLAWREAEEVAVRALNTLEGMPSWPSRNGLRERLRTGLDVVLKASNAVADKSRNENGGLKPGVGAAFQRVAQLMNHAVALAKHDEVTTALTYGQAAADDAVRVVASINALANDLELRAVRRLALAQLGKALMVCSIQHSLLEQDVSALECSHLLLTVEQELSEPEEASSIRALEPERLIGAQIEHAKNLDSIGDRPRLEDGIELVGKALHSLEGRDDVEGNGLRARACLILASLKYHRREISGVLEILEQGERAAEHGGDLGADTLSELRALKVNYLGLTGRPDEAATLARDLAASADETTPGGRIRAGNYLLNAAVADAQAGRFREAVEAIRDGLSLTLTSDPLSETAFRLLMVGSRTLLERSVRLSERLNLAAAALLDARRARASSDEERVGIDDAVHTQETYRLLVQRAVSFGDGEAAVVAADRARAGALLDLIVDAPLGDVARAKDPPELTDVDADEALTRAAEHVLDVSDRILVELGAPRPLAENGVRTLAARLPGPALVLHPLEDDIALLLLKRSGEVIAATSPIGLNEMLAFTRTLRGGLNIFSVPRGDREDPHVLPLPNAREFEDCRRWLGEALLGPVLDNIGNAEHLVVVPFGELGLVPFGVLAAPDAPLLDRMAVSLAPSLATVVGLQARGSWNRPGPRRSLVLGDPPLPSDVRLNPLGGARQEVRELEDRLQTWPGTGEATCLVGDDATEAAYREQAPTCDLVHLACHGLLEEPVTRSCLMLGPRADGEDGRLMAGEVAQVPLDDSLVVLSACQTALGRPAAEGVVGLARAFLQAGARAIVASLWSVDDHVTRHLVRVLYDALQAGRPVDEALRVASISTRNELRKGALLGADGEPLQEHPSLWAGFVVIGDAGSVHFDSGG